MRVTKRLRTAFINRKSWMGPTVLTLLAAAIAFLLVISSLPDDSAVSAQRRYVYTIDVVTLTSLEHGTLFVTYNKAQSAREATGYRINFAPDQEPFPGSDSETGNHYATGLYAKLTGLTPGVVYDVRVKAHFVIVRERAVEDQVYTSTSEVWGPWSDVVSLRVQDDTAPTTPTPTPTITSTPTVSPTVSPTDGVADLSLSSDFPGEIVAVWTAPSEAPANYRVTWAKVDEDYPSWTDASMNAYPTKTTHKITALEPGTEYKVSVLASYSGRSGAWSEQRARVIDDFPTTTPTATPTVTPTATPTVSPTDGVANLRIYSS